MIVRSIPAEDLHSAFGDGPCVYTSEAFNRLNAGKADTVRCFAGYDSNMRPLTGLIAGLRGDTWHAPFSAPYSTLLWRESPSTETIYDFLTELTDMFSASPTPTTLRLTLPPRMLDPDAWDRITIVAANMARRTYYDYNYHYPLDMCADYPATLTPEARRHLKRAEKQGFTFAKTDDIDRIYDIIDRHHRTKGYHMAMTLADVKATAEVIPSDFFLLTIDGKDVAACYSQRVAPGVAQLINWGDFREYSSLRPMNLMAQRICMHYASLGYRAYDFGPASTDGIPNTGLCRFKQSLGGVLSLKPTFLLG